MKHSEISTIDQALAYASELTPIAQTVILAGHAQFISFFLNRIISVNDALDQVTERDTAPLREIQNNFSQKEKIFVLYALCLQYLNSLSFEEFQALAAKWPEGYRCIIEYVQEYISTGEVMMADQDRGFLGLHDVDIEEDLGAMAEPDFVVIPEGDEIRLELFAAHFLAIILKLDADILLEL